MNLSTSTASSQWLALGIVIAVLLVAAAIGGTVGKLGFWAGILLIVAALVSHANNLSVSSILSGNPLSQQVA